MKRLLAAIVCTLLLVGPAHAASLQAARDYVDSVLTPLWTDYIRPNQEAFLTANGRYFQGLLYMDPALLPNNQNDANPVLEYAQMVEIVAGAAISAGDKTYTILQQPPEGWAFLLKVRDDAEVISAGTLTATGTRDGEPGSVKNINLVGGSRLIKDSQVRWTQVDSLVSTGVVRSAAGPALALYAVRPGAIAAGSNPPWEDFLPEWPSLTLPCAFWIDEYVSPAGPGYSATVLVRWDGRFYARTKGHGPEDRDVAWHEVP